jgi:hypothetical protein
VVPVCTVTVHWAASGGLESGPLAMSQPNPAFPKRALNVNSCNTARLFDVLRSMAF